MHIKTIINQRKHLLLNFNSLTNTFFGSELIRIYTLFRRQEFDTIQVDRNLIQLNEWTDIKVFSRMTAWKMH